MPDLGASGVTLRNKSSFKSRTCTLVSTKMSVDDVDAGQGRFGRCQAPEVGQLVPVGIVPFGGVVVVQ